MKKLKFRAWDKESKIMINGFALDAQGNILFTKKRSPDGKYKYSQVDGYDNDRFIVMQFTGLLDKNGKEIFEGDILIVKQLHDGDECVWRQPAGQAIPFEIKWDDDLRGFHLPARVQYSSHHYEIIGNRFENPELLQTN